MDLKQYRSKLIGSKEERAVSPVIGVILMVAITVILAAVIAAFVLDIGDLDEGAPNAQFDWETEGGNETSVTMTSGDDIDVSQIRVNSGEVDGNSDIDTAGDISSNSDTWTAGDTMQFSTGVSEVTITYVADGSSSIIAEHEA